jgi:ABC-type Fe3+-siderophore transport system permease subunit
MPFTFGLASAKYWTTLLPNILLLGAYVATSPGHANPWYGWFGFAVAAIIAAFTLAASGYTSLLYLKMPHDNPQ